MEHGLLKRLCNNYFRSLKRKFDKHRRLVVVSLLLLIFVRYISVYHGPGPIKRNVTYLKKHFGILPTTNPQLRHYRCPIKLLDPFAPQMMALINMTIFRSNYSCADDPSLGIFKEAAFHVENGHFLVRDVKFPGDVSCCFQQVYRHDDEHVRVEEKCQEIETDKHATAIQLPTETVMVTCNNSRDQVYYKDAFQLIHRKPEVEKRIKSWRDDQLKSNRAQFVNYEGRLNVLVIGMDSTSQMQFERALPLSKSYLDGTLKAVRIQGYNKVGDNSAPNVIPMITGMSLEEFEEMCWKYPLSSVESCPMLWKYFASEGYRTSFAEDNPTGSIFNYIYYNIFSQKPPTDYYFRTLSLLMETTLNFSDICYGPKLSNQLLLDNARLIADMFQEDGDSGRYFNFIWSTFLTHGTLDTHPLADKPLLELLEHLRGNGHLNHTAVFLVGDHGHRFNDNLEQAYYENRMPLAYIVLPPWFPNRYSKAFQNLQWNAENSVTSHFDMHKTILDILDLERFDSGNWRENRHFQPVTPEMNWRGQSLFELSPHHHDHGRNCDSAGIAEMWCPCVERLPLRNDSFLAVRAAEAVIYAVNHKIRNSHMRSVCEKIELRHIINASVLLVTNETLKKPECRRLIIENAVDETGGFCIDSILVQVRILGSPHDPIFNTLVVRGLSGDFLAPNYVTRDDWYSTKAHCVGKQLQPYCICNDYE